MTEQQRWTIPPPQLKGWHKMFAGIRSWFDLTWAVHTWAHLITAFTKRNGHVPMEFVQPFTHTLAWIFISFTESLCWHSSCCSLQACSFTKVHFHTKEQNHRICSALMYELLWKASETAMAYIRTCLKVLTTRDTKMWGNSKHSSLKYFCASAFEPFKNE